jgi:hypothetical protein
MDYKYPSLFTLVMIGDVREVDCGNLTKVSRYSGIIAGILGMWILIVIYK